MTREDEEKKAVLTDAIARGKRIDQFLADETIKAVLNGLELSYYTAWKGAATPTEREQIYSQVSAFDDLRESLKNIVASGLHATHELALLERDTNQI